MTTDEFLAGLKLRASDSAVKGTLAVFDKPPGRRPSERLLKLSKWYSTLDENDRGFLKEALDFTAESTIFGVLCILDGVRVIEDAEEKGEFELYYINGANRELLNPPSNPLHDAYGPFRSDE